MATKYAQANANYSAVVWLDAPAGSVTTAPGATDTAEANGKTIAINVNVTCAAATNTLGGAFTLTNGVTLTANVVAGIAACVGFSAASPAVANVNGSSLGGTTFNSDGIVNNGSGTLLQTGNSTGGSAPGYCANGSANRANGTFYTTGTATGGPGNQNYYAYENCGIYNASNGTFIHTGNVVGNSVYSDEGARNNSSGSMTINGDATGVVGAGAINYLGGSMTITGSATGGTGGASGATNFSTGPMYCGRAVGNDRGIGGMSTAAAYGVVSNLYNSLTTVGSIRYGTNGMSPTAGVVKVVNSTANTAVVIRSDTGAAKTLTDPAATVDFPGVGNVRFGTSFSNGNLTGTCHIPAAGSVALGVATDNTVGTAVLTAANVQTAIGGATIPAAMEAQGYTSALATSISTMTAGLLSAVTQMQAALEAQGYTEELAGKISDMTDGLLSAATQMQAALEAQGYTEAVAAKIEGMADGLISAVTQMQAALEAQGYTAEVAARIAELMEGDVTIDEQDAIVDGSDAFIAGREVTLE